MKTLIAAALGLLCPTTLAGEGGLANIVYDASLGSLPEEQGWGMTGVMPWTAAVVAGVLEQDTTPFNFSTCAGSDDQNQRLRWDATDLRPFSFSNTVVVEIDMKVISSEYGSAGCAGWPRAGFDLYVEDQAARIYRVGFGSSQIYLTNTNYQPFGHPSVVEYATDTTDAFHLYRLEIVGDSASLAIDGNPVLTLDSGSPVGSVPNRALFADGTIWSNSEFELRSVSVTTTDSSEVVRLGTPANPNAFCPGQTKGPVIGETWDPVIEHSVFVADATTDFALISGGPINTAPFLLVGSPSPGAPFAIAVPDIAALVGLTLCAQGGSLDSSFASHLANALDITIGSF